MQPQKFFDNSKEFNFATQKSKNNHGPLICRFNYMPGAPGFYLTTALFAGSSNLQKCNPISTSKVITGPITILLLLAFDGKNHRIDTIRLSANHTKFWIFHCLVFKNMWGFDMPPVPTFWFIDPKFCGKLESVEVRPDKHLKGHSSSRKYSFFSSRLVARIIKWIPQDLVRFICGVSILLYPLKGC